jgi:soluble lytic murein transglycosylase-like protein
MRPIFVLAILLLGLKAAFPEVKFAAIADIGLQDLQLHQAKAEGAENIRAQDNTAQDAKTQTQDAKTQDAKTPDANTQDAKAPDIKAPDTKAANIASQDAKFRTVKDQDRVWSADQNPLDGDTAGSSGESEVAESIAVAAPIESFRTAADIKKSNRVLASLTLPDVEAADVAHDQSEATSEPPRPQPATTDPAVEASVTDSIDDLCNALVTSARDNDLPVPFFANLIWQESRLHRDSVSKAGAMGIAQFMPEVAAEVGLDDPFDPHQAIPASARFLKGLRDQFGNLGYVAAAYNAGAGRVGLWLDRRYPLPRETRDYVLRVTGRTAEAWRRSPLHDSKLTFARTLPCRTLPAFAELEQAQQHDPDQTADTDDPGLRQEKVTTRVAHLMARRVAARGSTRFAKRIAMRVAMRGAAKPVAKVAQAQAAAQPAGNGGSVALPAVGEAKAAPAAKPAAATHVIARNFHARRDALRRPALVPHEKRRLA